MAKGTSFLAFALATVGFTSLASAHQSSFTYGRIDASADAKTIRYQLKIRSTDLFEAVGLDRDRDATDAEIMSGEQKLVAYIRDHVDLELANAECSRSTEPVTIEGGRDRYAVVTFVHACASPVTRLALDYDLFFDLDDRHQGLLLVQGESYQLKAPDHTRFEWTLGSPIEGGLGFVRSGVEHIVFGLDHILFLVSLLLMVVVTRSERGGWKIRPWREGAAYTAAIVTSFTIAHSITLIAAALGWIDLPGRFVESVIAASIVYIALENIFRPDPPRRYAVTFVFGLIHGLGFAAMLRPLLPPDAATVPLLLFNVGVELGQLALVAISLPLLYVIGHELTADRYRRLVLPLGGSMLAALGAIWLVERAFELTILGL